MTHRGIMRQMEAGDWLTDWLRRERQGGIARCRAAEGRRFSLGGPGDHPQAAARTMTGTRRATPGTRKTGEATAPAPARRLLRLWPLPRRASDGARRIRAAAAHGRRRLGQRRDFALAPDRRRPQPLCWHCQRHREPSDVPRSISDDADSAKGEQTKGALLSYYRLCEPTWWMILLII